jgi:hypothetical protein
VYTSYDNAESALFKLATQTKLVKSNITINEFRSKLKELNFGFITENITENEDGTESSVWQITTKEPVTFYLKNSHIVLTDELVNKFPRLKSVKNFMEHESEGHPAIGEIVFETGIKLGKPKNNPTFAEIAGLSKNTVQAKREELRTRGTKILSLSNANNRIQFNPQSDLILTKNKIALFSQIMYFINTGTNKS